MEFAEKKTRLQPCKNNAIWRRNLGRTHIPGPVFLFLFPPYFSLSRLLGRYDSPLHVFNFSPFESSFLIPLVRILENPRCRTRIRSFLDQTAPPTGPFALEKRIEDPGQRDLSNCFSVYIRKKDSQRRRGCAVGGDGCRLILAKSHCRPWRSNDHFRIIVIVHWRDSGARPDGAAALEEHHSYRRRENRRRAFCGPDTQ